MRETQLASAQKSEDRASRTCVDWDSLDCKCYVRWEWIDSYIVHRLTELPVWFGSVLKYYPWDLSLSLLCLGVSFKLTLWFHILVLPIPEED